MHCVHQVFVHWFLHYYSTLVWMPQWRTSLCIISAGEQNKRVVPVGFHTPWSSTVCTHVIAHPSLCLLEDKSNTAQWSYRYWMASNPFCSDNYLYTKQTDPLALSNWKSMVTFILQPKWQEWGSTFMYYYTTMINNLLTISNSLWAIHLSIHEQGHIKYDCIICYLLQLSYTCTATLFLMCGCFTSRTWECRINKVKQRKGWMKLRSVWGNFVSAQGPINQKALSEW